MRTLSLTQGSQDWHSHRREHFNASDAPAMLGVSAYKTRTELLHEIATGVVDAEIDEATLQRFADGHRFEALARPLAEEIIGDSLSPTVGVSGKLSASFDGITFDELVIFEHKTFNCSLKDITDASQLPEQYRAQMEQQLMVSGASKCLFMATKWNGDQLVEKMNVWYESDQARRDQSIQGWVQFEIDLENYVPPEVVDRPEPDAIMQLPTVIARATGTIAACNLAEIAPQYDRFIDNANEKLETIDIVNGTAIAKFSRAAAVDLIESEKRLIAEISPLDELSKKMKLYAAKFNKIGLDYEKAVDRMKKAEADAALVKVGAEYDEHVSTLQIVLDPINLVVEKPNFAGALRSLKTPESKNAALNAALANAKVAASTVAKDVGGKLFWFNSNHKEHILLFPDLQTVIYKLTDDFKLLVEARIAKHNAAEEARRVAEREQIRIEEEAKAKAKVEAEALAKAQAEAAIKNEAEAKDNAKAEAEAKAKRIQDDLDAAKSRRVAADAAAVIEPIKHEALAPKEIVKSIVATVAQEMETISKEEYESLKKDSEILDCLRACGVDNWQGWDDAMDMYHENEDMEEAA